MIPTYLASPPDRNSKLLEKRVYRESAAKFAPIPSQIAFQAKEVNALIYESHKGDPRVRSGDLFASVDVGCGVNSTGTIVLGTGPCRELRKAER